MPSAATPVGKVEDLASSAGARLEEQQGIPDPMRLSVAALH